MSAPVLDITAQDRDFLTAMSKVELDLLRSQAQQTTELRDAADRNAYANESRNYRLQDQIMLAVHQGNQEQIAATERNGTANLTAIDRNGTAAILATERNGGLNLAATERIGGLNVSTMERIGAQQMGIMERIGSQSSTQAERIGSSILAETGRISRDLATVMLTGQSDNLRNFAALQKQASDNYSSIQLEAQKAKDALALQMATQGSDLKDAIRSSEIDRLRDDLRKSETEALFNRRYHHHHCHDYDHHHRHRDPYPYPFPYPFPFFGGGGPPFGVGQGQGQGGR